jgi:FAD:protein FMN transferase
MEIDFGGLGKEYAVDRAHLLMAARANVPTLVNFGGDLRVSGPRADGSPWRIAVETVCEDARSPAVVEIKGGALTTSGDAKRFLMKNGVRYSHILDLPWPWRKGVGQSALLPTNAAPPGLSAEFSFV